MIGMSNSIDGLIPNPRTGSSDASVTNSNMWHNSSFLRPHDRQPLATSLTYLTNNI